MTYRLIKLLDRLHLEACTCFIGLDAGLRSFITLLAPLLSALSASTSPDTTSKAEFVKIACTPAVKAAFSLSVCNTKFFFYLQRVSKLKGRVYFYIFYRTSKIKTACQTGPLHLELSLLP